MIRKPFAYSRKKNLDLLVSQSKGGLKKFVPRQGPMSPCRPSPSLMPRQLWPNGAPLVSAFQRCRQAPSLCSHIVVHEFSCLHAHAYLQSTSWFSESKIMESCKTSSPTSVAKKLPASDETLTTNLDSLREAVPDKSVSICLKFSHPKFSLKLPCWHLQLGVIGFFWLRASLWLSNHLVMSSSRLTEIIFLPLQRVLWKKAGLTVAPPFTSAFITPGALW